VTCGSSVKLANQEFNVRLHSHDVKYGSGSGQQVSRGEVGSESVGEMVVGANIEVCLCECRV